MLSSATYFPFFAKQIYLLSRSSPSISNPDHFTLEDHPPTTRRLYWICELGLFSISDEWKSPAPYSKRCTRGKSSNKRDLSNLRATTRFADTYLHILWQSMAVIAQHSFIQNNIIYIFSIDWVYRNYRIDEAILGHIYKILIICTYILLYYKYMYIDKKMVIIIIFMYNSILSKTYTIHII